MQVIFCVAKLRQTVCDPLREIGNLVAGLVWFGFTNNNPKRILKQRFVQGEAFAAFGCELKDESSLQIPFDRQT